MREELFQEIEKLLEENSRKTLSVGIYYSYKGINETIDFYNNFKLKNDGRSLLLELGKGKMVYIDFELFSPFVAVFSISSAKVKIPKFFELISFSNEDFLEINNATSFLLEYEDEDTIRKASIASTSLSDVQDLLKTLKSKFSISACSCGESGKYKIDRNGKISFVGGNFIGSLYEIKTFLSRVYYPKEDFNKEITMVFSSAQKDIHKITKRIIDFIGYGTYKIVGNRSIAVITDGYNILYLNMDMVKFKVRMVKGENFTLIKKIESFIQKHCDPEARKV